MVQSGNILATGTWPSNPGSTCQDGAAQMPDLLSAGPPSNMAGRDSTNLPSMISVAAPQDLISRSLCPLGPPRRPGKVGQASLGQTEGRAHQRSQRKSLPLLSNRFQHIAESHSVLFCSSLKWGQLGYFSEMSEKWQKSTKTEEKTRHLTTCGIIVGKLNGRSDKLI